MNAGGEGLRVTLVAACPFPCLRGTAARVLLQARALQRLGADVQVTTLQLAEFPAPAGLRVLRIPGIPGSRDTRPGPTLTRLALLDPLLLARTVEAARRQRAQVLHGHHAEGGLLALAAGRLLGLPVVFDAHTSLAAELPSYALPLPAVWRARLGARLDGWLTARADHVVAVSARLRWELLARGRVPPQRVSVVPMGLDPDDPARGLPGPPPDAPPTLVYAGGLARFQRLDLLGRAFARVHARCPEARLLIVTGDPASELEAVWPEAREHPALWIERPRDVRDALRHLARAHVAVSPRTAPGGFPQKILNAMRLGVPVVACHGSGDLLRHGETGWVVPDDDPTALADGILELLRRPALRRRLGEAARAEVACRYTWEIVARGLLAAYTAARRGTSGRRSRV